MVVIKLEKPLTTLANQNRRNPVDEYPGDLHSDYQQNDNLVCSAGKKRRTGLEKRKLSPGSFRKQLAGTLAQSANCPLRVAGHKIMHTEPYVFGPRSNLIWLLPALLPLRSTPMY